MDEHLFFHADPHPANILVRENNQLTFIDFGSCGSFNREQKIALEQIVLSMKNQDAEGMARASLSLLEPMPPIDVPALMKEAQAEYMRVLHTFNTPAEFTEWWERTSARQWLALIRVARQFNLPMNLHMLRMIRATLLYDTLVLRLDREVDRYYEYTEFMKDRAQLVKKRWRQRLRDNSGDGFFLRLEELGEAVNDLILQAQKTMSRPLVRFGPTVDKWIFATSVLSRMAGRILIVTLLALGMVNVVRFGANEPVSLPIALQIVIENTFYQIFLVAAGVLNIRHILFRLRERDSGGNS
jgi:predicted unusual protein kinase regulating ubiquinone biosynthesis (AarF/ABC1/UbiB family)